MEYNVSHLLKSSVGATREYELDRGTDLALDDEITAIIEGGHVRFDRTDRGILARGNVEATVELACARCLDPVQEPIAADFAEEFEPSIDVVTGRALPAPENDLVFTIDERHILDLSEAIRQNLIAALPMQPLCRPDCAGLCPVCGVNRNEEACDCVVDDENHPFAALAELLEKKSS